MTQNIDGAAVASYLREHPEFFRAHAELFTVLELPDPHLGAAVSLQERQCAILRERVKGLEARLAELVRIGADNDRLARDIDDWTVALFAARGRDQVATAAVESLRHLFGFSLVELRQWTEPPAAADAGIAQWAAALTEPRCGSDLDLWTAGGLGPDWALARSIALIPLQAADERVFGLVAVGSADPLRFTSDLGTDLLARIGRLCAAALHGPA